MQSYRTSPQQDKRGGSLATTGDKAPHKTHHAPVIRADPTLVPEPLADLGEGVPPPFNAPIRKAAKAKSTSAKAQDAQAFPPPAPVPAWARASGRTGEDPLFAAGAGLALLDAFLRRDPPAAGALRSRLALQSTAASAKVLRLNADERALRDLRFAVGDAGPAARLLQLWRDLAGRPPSLDPSRLAAAADLLDLSVPLTRWRKAWRSRAGQGTRSPTPPRRLSPCSPPSRTPRPPTPRFWRCGRSTAALPLRLRWPRPLPLIATRILGSRQDWRHGVR
jgi:hypothetical protein